MVDFWLCFSEALSPTVQSVLAVLSVYFVTVGSTIAGNLLVSDIRLDGLDYELSEFVNHYKDTSLWWATSFFTSIVALTIGAQLGVLFDAALLWIFFLPALYHFNSNYPFSLNCTYRATQTDNTTHHGQNDDNIVQMGGDGVCDVELNVQTGSNVDEFCLDLDFPQGIDARNLGTKIRTLELLQDEGKIKGEAAPGRDKFSFDLYLEKTGQIIPGRNNFVISDDASSRSLETIRIQPN